jgi:hypothetical protein
MNKSIILILTLFIASITVGGLAACKSPAAPAQFEVISLEVKTTEINPGETANLSATVRNVGGTAGVYSASMYVDGAKRQSNDILLEPGASETVSFTVQENQSGSHKISVGAKTSTLTVRSNRVAQPVDLRYDSGQARDFLAVIKPCTGYVVSFEPPSDMFTVNDIQIYGLIFGGRGFSIRDIEVQIWDKNRKMLYTTTFPGKKFPLVTYISTNFEKLGDWVEVYVPDVKVTGPFFIHVYAGLDNGQGFRMGADDSVTNTHSDVTIRDESGVDSSPEIWPYGISPWYGNKSRVNWMVRVKGVAMVPQNP